MKTNDEIFEYDKTGKIIQNTDSVLCDADLSISLSDWNEPPNNETISKLTDINESINFKSLDYLKSMDMEYQLNILTDNESRYSNSSDSNEDGECKIFVGNVPYHCTQQEFIECFQSVPGFLNAEIITVHKTNISRGFGFVSVKNFECAEELKKRNDIILKGRNLRFTPYLHDSEKRSFDGYSNYVFVDGIGENKTNKWLKNVFSQYEPIGRCFVSVNQDTGEKKYNGVVEILDDEKYRLILNKRFHQINGITIETSRYKTKEINQPYIVDNKDFKMNTYHTRDPNYQTIAAQNQKNIIVKKTNQSREFY